MGLGCVHREATEAATGGGGWRPMSRGTRASRGDGRGAMRRGACPGPATPRPLLPVALIVETPDGTYPRVMTCRHVVPEETGRFPLSWTVTFRPVVSDSGSPLLRSGSFHGAQGRVVSRGSVHRPPRVGTLRRGFASGCWGRSGACPIAIKIAEPPAPSTMRVVHWPSESKLVFD